MVRIHWEIGSLRAIIVLRIFAVSVARILALTPLPSPSESTMVVPVFCFDSGIKIATDRLVVFIDADIAALHEEILHFLCPSSRIASLRSVSATWVSAAVSPSREAIS